MALLVLPALLPRDMWKSEYLWSWGHRLPCWKVPREGRQQHASAQIPAASPVHRRGETHLPPWLSGGHVSPCHHLQNGCCPVSQAGVPLVPMRHREGLSPVTWAQLHPPLPTRTTRGLRIHASGVHGLRKVSDPKGLSDADLVKPPTLAPPEKRRGGPADMESISPRPSLKYTKHQRCKPECFW